MAESEKEWEHAILVGAGLWLAWRFFVRPGLNLKSAQSAIALDIPGLTMPETGDLVEVPKVHTVIDAHELPALYNKALQLAETDLGWMTPYVYVQEWLTGRDPQSLPIPPPEVDPDYDVPAAVFASQSAIETRDGQAAFNNNLGNVTVKQGQYYRNHAAEDKYSKETDQPGTVFRFGSYNFPLQGAVAHVMRVKRLWPVAYRAAYSGDVQNFAKGLQEGKLKYAGVNVSADGLAKAIHARAALLGYRIA